MQRDTAQLRRSAAFRVGASVLIAGAVTAAAIVALWGPLDVQTDVVGYPIFADFNVDNYFTAYYLAVALFPLLALGLFSGLTKLAPRIGLAPAPARGALRPATLPVEARPRLESDPPLSEEGGARRWGICLGRTVLVGGVLGLESGVAVDSVHPALELGIAAYVALALLAARLLSGRRHAWSLQVGLSAVNSIGAVLCFAGLFVVSLSTEVRIASDGSTRQYHWLPIWLALPGTVALAALVLTRLRGAGSGARAFAAERLTLLLVAAPVGLVILHQSMPGDLGPLEGFHFGEQLGGARLVADGFFPWRDVVLTHGLLQDVVYTFGRGAFGDSVWGFLAGISMIMAPLYLLSLYFLFVYLVGRSWPALLFGFFLLIDVEVVPEQFRLILWAPILLLLATDLRRPAPAKSVGLAFLLVVQAILTPEAAPAIVAVALVLVVYEWYWGADASSLAARFSRTLWVGVSGVAFAAIFAGYLAAHGALDDFLYVSLNLVHGHALSGGLRPDPTVGTISDPLYYFLAFAPPAALLICFAYAASRLRMRRPIYTEDWVMAAAAIFLLVYYTKFLARMDTGHLYQPFVAGVPLILYIVYRAFAWADDWLRTRRRGDPILRVTRHPASLVAALVGLAVIGGTVRDRIDASAAAYRPVVAAPTQDSKIGYTQLVDRKAYGDISRAIDAYLEPEDPLFDFANTPLLFHYLLGRDPSTRYFHVAVAYSAELQSDLIRRLEKKEPKLIVFDNDGTLFTALSNWDGVPNMVRLYDVADWILDRYKPLLWTHGFTIYARQDQPVARNAELQLAEPPTTHGVPFTVQPCTWGAAPNFLSGPGMPDPDARAKAVGARARPATDASGKRVIRFEPPSGSDWDDYRWLEVDFGPGGPAPGYLSVYDTSSRASSERKISFQATSRSPRDYVVPVGSCSQWHGYRAPRLYLSSTSPQDISAVRLIR